ncbi:MAG: aminomethyl-transferring glycine dehydrogenase subunit GcvPB [Waddliaceae bacterium]
MSQTIFEKSQKGQKAFSIPFQDPEFEKFSPAIPTRKDEILLPEISELDLLRHFVPLSQKNMGIDTHFYPLGSCTMKLNPRVNEQAASLLGFCQSHPLAPDDSVQGNLQLIHELTTLLCQICGMHSGTLQPNAGAQGELVGLKMIAAYHKKRNDLERVEILIPDSAHGTNPATVTMAGMKTVPLKSCASGDIDLEDLKSKLSNRTAGLMLTNPNTLGVFSAKILEITKLVHEHGGLLYYDGANLNPLLGVVRIGEMGFDVLHINLHKTFSTPHGGGGPGSGPVLCCERLTPFLPVTRVLKKEDRYYTSDDFEDSIGRIASFHGNFGIYLRAYLYIKLHGMFGLRKVAEMAVLNANYLKKKIAPLFTVPYSQPCFHEFVVQADNYLNQGVRALDIAKRLLDYGVHAPTVYFPLIVKECLLIEPTETESKATLDRFIEILETIVDEIQTDVDLVLKAPHTYSVSRLNEVKAAKQPILTAMDI